MSEDTDQNPKEGFFQKLNYLRIGLGARVREEVPKAVGKRIGDVASKVSGAAAETYTRKGSGEILNGISTAIKESDLYEPAKRIAPYVGGTVLGAWGIDTLLNKDKEEVPYRMWRRRLKAGALLAFSATCYGLGIYSEIQRYNKTQSI
ncbi:MAG: hypothetical protein COZ04_00745 [Candidatus Aenigmarchaeota archaeon CG_4_10_14_3_um_filter_37_21]|nr:MAG: hypothetical protein AUJ50_02525 [Candidatus Aenigmarchaeota archaeon CG1_02_38_14]PIX50379.1 MAG: hypothetical protein COZ52_04425 [Candidatus Aenigmarchaeota archaeon CG_4_8_14_3_um_filter_37_24]PIY36314.1 MAG: hypothetical protein COZ04_00745 [Candidatus Aenigmarchaeota archaeon CG_4_10_14_3_um_filter_37_21]